METKENLVEFISLAREKLERLEKFARIVEGDLLNERSKNAVSHQMISVVEDQIDLYSDFCEQLLGSLPKIQPAPSNDLKEPSRRKEDTHTAFPPVTTPNNGTTPIKRR